jgi:S1-C subfamily serine protease
LQRTRTGEVVTEPLGAGVVWDQRGHVVVTYRAIARALAPADAGAGGSAAAAGAPAGLPSAGTPAADAPATATAAGAPAAAAATRTLRVALADPSDGRAPRVDATLVGASPAYDLAVLLLADPAPELLSPVPLGANSDVRVGQSAYAVSLLGLSYGVVSGVRRPFPAPGGQLLPGGALQTDASVDGGNSGGALLDSAGRLMGLCAVPASVRAAAPGPQRAASLSFAIPVDTVRAVVPQLIAFGRVNDAPA